ncbi:hypothetical protein [Halochromatium roseum]|uniref:hypothetical protein n=1 Tax=Halochromatium roseum TaxID=391920 RepID=UPI001911A97A|nr:hypothetical protein [Halochromatium roseum]MBK5939404.1 hypothetical protein [Halochromatium roseum]
MMNKNVFPPGWDEGRVAKVLEHYETQTEDEAVAEDEAAFELSGQTLIEVPLELVPIIRELLAKYNAGSSDLTITG